MPKIAHALSLSLLSFALSVPLAAQKIGRAHV